MPLFQLTIFPTDKQGPSGSDALAPVIARIAASGLPYQLNAMATLIEGEWDEVITLVGACREILRRSHDRVYLILTVDDRQGAVDRIHGKVRSIHEKLANEGPNE